MKTNRAIAVAALAAAGISAAPMAGATMQTRTVTIPASRLCTLSVPTTDTGVRPKATGFRNEGKANAFVICAFDSAPDRLIGEIVGWATAYFHVVDQPPHRLG